MVLTIVILVCLSAIGASKTTLMITKKNRTNSRISATANTTTTNAYATDAAPTTPTIRRLSPTSDIEDRVRNTVKKININPLGIC